jgi:hypothetical protein
MLWWAQKIELAILILVRRSHHHGSRMLYDLKTVAEYYEWYPKAMDMMVWILEDEDVGDLFFFFFYTEILHKQ